MPAAYDLPSVDLVQERYYFNTDDFPKMTLYEYVKRSNQGHETAVAFDFLDAHITYGGLIRRIDHTACALSEMGIGTGDTVAIVMPTQPETFYLLYACSKIGAVACFIDLRYPRAYLNETIEKSKAKLVFGSTATGAELSDQLNKLVMVSPGESLGIIEYAASSKVRKAAKTAPANRFEGRCLSWKEFLKGSADRYCESAPYIPNRTVVMVGTGGTTGIPKLVELSNDAINAAVFQCQHANFDFRRGDVWYDIMPPFIAYGLVDGLHLPLVMGMSVLLEPSPGIEALVEALSSGKVNHMTASPSFYIDLVHHEQMGSVDMSMVRSPIVGGRSVNPRQEAAINTMLASCGCPSKLRVGWGLTESCGAISVAGTNALVKPQSVGPTLIGGITAAFKESQSPDGSLSFEEMPYVPARQSEVGQELTGELWYSGPNLFTRYYENAEETSHALVDYDGRTWLRTGDVGYVDSEGSVFITNRVKDFIARKDGFKTPPKEIEDVLVLSGCIDEVAVVGTDDPDYEGNSLIVAFYTLDKRSANASPEDEMRKCVIAHLAGYKHPDAYIRLQRMPYTPIGKIDRTELRKLAANHFSG